MQISMDDVSFFHPQPSQYDLIYHWFTKPHVNEFFDAPKTERAIPDLKNYLQGRAYFWTPWLAAYQGKPFAYFMTARVRKNETDIWAKWREKKGRTYSLDFLIGEEAFLGKGMSHLLIKKFIKEKFPHAAAFLIDPELRNIHAIHISEKVGFVIVEEFKGEHGPHTGVTHLMMKLKISK